MIYVIYYLNFYQIIYLLIIIYMYNKRIIINFEKIINQDNNISIRSFHAWKFFTGFVISEFNFF